SLGKWLSIWTPSLLPYTPFCSCAPFKVVSRPPSIHAPVQPCVPSTTRAPSRPASPHPFSSNHGTTPMPLSQRSFPSPGTRPGHPRSYTQDLVRPLGHHAPRSGLSLSLCFFFLNFSSLFLCFSGIEYLFLGSM
ncbi:hypothetical protein DFH09DRAFT_1151236, partial [Mycena vulgaris]